MRPREVKNYVIEVYKADRSSLLFLGPPGIGKSTAAREAAQELAKIEKKEFIDYDDFFGEEILKNPEKYFLFIDLRLLEVEPSDLVGIPKEINKAIIYKPFLWASCLSQTAGILFLDEFTNIQRLDVISASYKIILERKSGFTKFSDKIMVITAGNRPEESTVANLLPAPLVDRLIILPVEKPTIEEWARWMDENYPNWDKRVLAYLIHFKDDFLRLPLEIETLTNFPTPRSWTKLATLLSKISSEFWEETARGTVGLEVGSKFSVFLNSVVPEVRILISHPQQFQNLNLDSQYLASVLVGQYLNENLKETEKVIPLLKVMSESSREFLVLTILSAGPKKPEVTLNIIRKEKSLAGCLEEISDLRKELEI